MTNEDETVSRLGILERIVRDSIAKTMAEAENRASSIPRPLIGIPVSLVFHASVQTDDADSLCLHGIIVNT